ncbi:MAG TPA: hypothetical protein VFJ65_11155 [Solirubrobacterales bacterium]|jgi:hypothetical protein|nr:hypothetical protein [Solirubrobacterales bacterium]
MQAKRSPVWFDEQENKQTQRAVLSFLLAEFPAQHTQGILKYMGFGDDADALSHAVRALDVVGLLWCEGEVVMPTAAARHFDWLELS